jgi:plastocyanin
VSWLAILLALAALGGNPAPGAVKAKPHCAAHAKHCKHAPKKKHKPKKAKPKAPATPPAAVVPAPRAEPTPSPWPIAAATPSPSPTPVATATPNPYPTRTGIDLREYRVRASYHTLAAGTITFGVTDLGEDAHNFSVRGGGKEYGGIDLESGEAGTFTVTLAPGTYTLYCDLPDHEALGMSTEIDVK